MVSWVFCKLGWGRLEMNWGKGNGGLELHRMLTPSLHSLSKQMVGVTLSITGPIATMMGETAALPHYLPRR